MRMMRGLGFGERGERIFKCWVEGEDRALMEENGGREDECVGIHIGLQVETYMHNNVILSATLSQVNVVDENLTERTNLHIF